MSHQTALFTPTGRVRTFVAPITGDYVIEASGAQGGSGGGPGGRGARVKGTFKLYAGDFLQILVGKQGTAGTTPHQPAGGGGGGSFVWRGGAATPLPPKPMLAAGGGGGGSGSDGVITIDAGHGAAPGGRYGHGGASDSVAFHYSGGGGAGWLGIGSQGSGPTECGAGEQWAGGKGADYCCNRGGDGGFGGGGGGSFLGQGSGGGGGFSGGGGGTQKGPGGGGGGSYNAGTQQSNTPGARSGDGCVTISPVPDHSTLAWSRESGPATASETMDAATDVGPRREEFAGYF
jgi:hypothetical protein